MISSVKASLHETLMSQDITRVWCSEYYTIIPATLNLLVSTMNRHKEFYVYSTRLCYYEVYSTKLLSIMDYIISSLRSSGWWHAIFSNVPKGLFEQIKRIKNTFKFFKIDTVCMLLMEMEKYRQYPVNSLLQEQVVCKSRRQIR